MLLAIALTLFRVHGVEHSVVSSSITGSDVLFFV